MPFVKFLYSLMSKPTHLICCILQQRKKENHQGSTELRDNFMSGSWGLQKTHTCLPTLPRAPCLPQGHQALPQEGLSPALNSAALHNHGPPKPAGPCPGEHVPASTSSCSLEGAWCPGLGLPQCPWLPCSCLGLGQAMLAWRLESH